MEICNEIRHMDLSDKTICHCGGSVSSEIFKDANPKMGFVSVHPMPAFNSRHTSIEAISGAFFTVEDGKTAADRLSAILLICGNNFKVITSENKAKKGAV